MAKVKLITYDLKKPGQDYSELYEVIKKYDDWWHCMNNIWLVKTSESCGDIADKLLNCIDSNDKLLVTELSGKWACYIKSKECTDWLHKNL
ncbi:SinR family protein [Halobacteriovorax sp. YZS-1-2]|uniref:SinR family protein n=1 Tax=Halobacteriovorax sp. YZS-1-2 TaxID=3391177 RepID=UPI00399A94D1